MRTAHHHPLPSLPMPRWQRRARELCLREWAQPPRQKPRGLHPSCPAFSPSLDVPCAWGSARRPGDARGRTASSGRPRSANVGFSRLSVGDCRVGGSRCSSRDSFSETEARARPTRKDTGGGTDRAWVGGPRLDLFSRHGDRGEGTPSPSWHSSAARCARVLACLRSGTRTGELGAAIQSTIEAAGFSAIRDYVGYGIGEKPMQDPQLPCFGARGRGARIVGGTMLHVHVIAAAGAYDVVTAADGWTVATKDGRPSVLFTAVVRVNAEGVRRTHATAGLTARE